MNTTCLTQNRVIYPHANIKINEKGMVITSFLLLQWYKPSWAPGHILHHSQSRIGCMTQFALTQYDVVCENSQIWPCKPLALSHSQWQWSTSVNPEMMVMCRDWQCQPEALLTCSGCLCAKYVRLLLFKSVFLEVSLLLKFYMYPERNADNWLPSCPSLDWVPKLGYHFLVSVVSEFQTMSTSDVKIRCRIWKRTPHTQALQDTHPYTCTLLTGLLLPRGSVRKETETSPNI